MLVGDSGTGILTRQQNLIGSLHIDAAYSRRRIRGKAECIHGCKPINQTLTRLPFGATTFADGYRAFCTCHLASIRAGSWMDGYLHARADLHYQRPSSIQLYPVLHESCIGRSQAELATFTLKYNHWKRKSGVAYVPFTYKMCFLHARCGLECLGSPDAHYHPATRRQAEAWRDETVPTMKSTTAYLQNTKRVLLQGSISAHRGESSWLRCRIAHIWGAGTVL